MTSKIDRLFGSKTRVTLLSKLLTNPDRSFHIRELSKDLRIPYSMLYKEEKNLVDLGILVEEKRGKVTLVSLNRGLPYLTELKGLMVKTAGLSDLLRDALSELKGIRYALVYGSFASGGESESSDVDVLIVGHANEEGVLRIVSKAERKLDREINYILWDEKEFGKRIKDRHHLLADIARRPVIMLIGDEDEFRRTVKK